VKKGNSEQLGTSGIKEGDRCIRGGSKRQGPKLQLQKKETGRF
jgi:hypothetical protein